jgi:quinol monooxygenase YgiN
VLVVVQYQVDPRCATHFRKVMDFVARSRKRSGATRWSLLEDAERPGQWAEFFSCASWMDYLRQNERMMETDRMRDEEIRNCLVAGTSPQFRRYFGQPP